MTSESFEDFGYEEIKAIGRGQYGLVYLVRSVKDQLLYVCKSIDLTCLSEKERDTAKQEVELLRKLEHPNIVEYKDNFFMGNAIVISMEYCEGGDLASYIKDMSKRRTRIKEAQVMSWFVQILLALEHVHAARILHRDIKTSNLFLTQKTTLVKLGDFGISRQFTSTMELAHSVVGTPHYMSPEVCENKPYTFKSDVWSLGCVLYELCMLKHAFAADNLLGLVHKIVSGKYDSIPPMYSANLNNLIQRMLTRNASTRPSIRMLLDDKNTQGYVATARSRIFAASSPTATRHGHRTGFPGSSAKSNLAKSRNSKPKQSASNAGAGKKVAQAWSQLRGETPQAAAEEEELYEDDFCSEGDTESDRDDVDFDFGNLPPVYEDSGCSDMDTMSVYQTAESATETAVASIRCATSAAVASVARPQMAQGVMGVRRVNASSPPSAGMVNLFQHQHVRHSRTMAPNPYLGNSSASSRVAACAVRSSK